MIHLQTSAHSYVLVALSSDSLELVEAAERPEFKVFLLADIVRNLFKGDDL